ncbi:MAG: hypothetical protein K1X67_01015 [Fimbriimonadaceae bacterium]|nr:hypothetical protein [Fimbriimonadaceae bacterium]
MRKLIAISAVAVSILTVGMLTSHRAETQPQAKGVVVLQASSPGYSQLGNTNVSGTGLFGALGIGTGGIPAERLDVNGSGRFLGLKLPVGAASGRVLTSDSTGTASWQVVNISGLTAGGDLTGTYPNPLIGAGKVTSASILDLSVGNADLANLSVTNSKIANVAWSKVTGTPSSMPPSGPAGGDLTGSFPNPLIGTGRVDSTKLALDEASLLRVSGGVLTSVDGRILLGSTFDHASLTVQGDAFYGTAIRGNGNAGVPIIDGQNSDDPISGYFQRSGVNGYSSGQSGIGFGVGGMCGVEGWAGVAGTFAQQTFGHLGTATEGASGEHSSTGNHGALGQSSNGVYGEALSNNGNGLVGTANNGTQAYGVWGISSSGYAGVFSGNVQVYGTLSKSAGSFKIDHPLAPADKYLYHSFVESPDMKNIYDGVTTTGTNGEAWITLPDWFEALNGDYRYQLTVIDERDSADFVMAKVAREIQGGRFKIRTSKPNTKVSWQVTGIRRDPYALRHRIPVEQWKSPEERGYYIHPDLYGADENLRVDMRQKAPQPTPRPAGGVRVWQKSR